MFRRFARGQRGFTMIEMMVVLIIIAVLIGVGIKFYSGYIENAKVTKARANISTMQAGLDAYYVQSDDSTYPDTDDELVNAGIRPLSGGSWDSEQRTLEAKDPWGQNYIYKVSSDGKSYVVYTGKTGVQGQSGAVVAGGGVEGESESPKVSTNTEPGTR